MTTDEERIEHAARNTEVIRPPRQTLSSFGTTSTTYYLITEPAYTEPGASETVIREGRVVTEKPRIITPYYLSRLDGFTQNARKYFDTLARLHGGDSPGLFYTYRNEPKDLSIVSENWRAVADRLNAELDRRGDPLVSIVKGQDDMWDVSLLKFIYEITRSSLESHLGYFSSRGLLSMDSSGLPFDARLRIEEMFRQVARGERDTQELKNELDHWNVFQEYQDRFLAFFRKGR